VNEDQNRKLVFTRATPVPAVSATANADDLHRVALVALNGGKARAAAQGFRRVTELEPKHLWAWNNLGRAYLQLGKLDSAELALRRQVEINPFDHYAHNNLGLALRRAGRREEALAAFRQQIEVNPLDEYAHANLGRLLADMHRDSAAALALEQAVSITPDDTALYIELGNSYLRLHRGADAIIAFNRALALSPSPDMWNNVAYALAEQRTELDTAEAYVRRAIDAVAAQLRDVTAQDATFSETIAVGRLGSFWDTLGWIYFARGDLKNAERYVRASWLLNYQSVVGEHLGQIEQRLGRAPDAIHTYTLAMNAPMPSKTIRPRLVKLLGGSEREADRRIELARSEFTSIRTVRLTGGVAADISGEVQIQLVPAGANSSRARATGVHVTRGPAQLERLKSPIRAAQFSIAFPDADPASLVVRAIVSCSSAGQCAAVLMPSAVLQMPGSNVIQGTVIERRVP
jgi:tetratricopeptide (TPR) repeat protein